KLCTVLILFSVFVIFEGMITSGCNNGSAGDEVVARVENSVLTNEELNRRIIWKGLGEEQKRKYVENWINRELLYKEAIQQNLDKTPDLELEIEQVKKEFLVNRLVDKTFAEKIKITEQEIESYYNKNQNLFKVQDDERWVLHLLTNTREEAREALQEINAGKDFREVVSAYSSGIFKDNKGDLGYIKRGDVIDEISRVAFSLAKDAVSGIIKSPYGYHIIKVIDIREEGDIEKLEQVRNEIIQRLRISKEKALYYDLLAELQNKYEVYINVPEEMSSVPQ
ncbi:MAG: peptidylprolyl isomerase, partial [bacterium]